MLYVFTFLLYSSRQNVAKAPLFKTSRKEEIQQIIIYNNFKLNYINSNENEDSCLPCKPLLPEKIFLFPQDQLLLQSHGRKNKLYLQCQMKQRTVDL